MTAEQQDVILQASQKLARCELEAEAAFRAYLTYTNEQAIQTLMERLESYVRAKDVLIELQLAAGGLAR